MHDEPGEVYRHLLEVCRRPEPFECYTADTLWTDPHISKQMLCVHLDPSTDLASRKPAFIERSVEWIQSRFSLGSGSAVADFGCGPGLYTTRFAACGAHVTGVDFSLRSLEHARREAKERGLDIDFVHANYLEFDSEKRFDLITLIYCDFCALSAKQRARLLQVWQAHLQPGGAVLMDVSTPAALSKRIESTTCAHRLMDGFWAEEDYYGFHTALTYETPRVTLDRYRICTPKRTLDVFNWLQYFTRQELEDELRAAGFVAEQWYANVAGDPYDEDAPELAVVARPAG